jgi:beta-N-acetylhexosaminidase
MKHIPGHGRAAADSHLELPVVETALETLEQTDFETFRALADAPMAMTAHVVFTDVDPDACVTLSHRAIQTVVRGFIGFDGLLMSDDLSMHALGDAGHRPSRAHIRRPRRGAGGGRAIRGPARTGLRPGGGRGAAGESGP